MNAFGHGYWTIWFCDPRWRAERAPPPLRLESTARGVARSRARRLARSIKTERGWRARAPPPLEDQANQIVR